MIYCVYSAMARQGADELRRIKMDDEDDAMRRRRSILRAYRRKWRRLSREDQVFVIKFLAGACLILIAVIVLVCLLVAHVVRGAGGDAQTLAGNAVAQISAVSGEDRTAGVSKISAVMERFGGKDGAEGDLQDEEELNSEEAELLARLVYAEAGEDSDETQIAVASVILNRVASDSYPDTIAEVIYQDGQYPTVTSGAIDQEPDERARENARYVYQNGSQIPSNVLYQSGDIQGSGLWAQLDGEYFCYE